MLKLLLRRVFAAFLLVVSEHNQLLASQVLLGKVLRAQLVVWVLEHSLNPLVRLAFWVDHKGPSGSLSCQDGVVN